MANYIAYEYSRKHLMASFWRDCYRRHVLCHRVADVHNDYWYTFRSSAVQAGDLLAPAVRA